MAVEHVADQAHVQCDQAQHQQPAPAEPSDAHDYADEAAPPPVVAMGEHPDQQRRGGRSRHDRSGKREKSTKFAEYILGNVIGEGEFGKVRLGWKQDDRVQVCFFPIPIHPLAPRFHCARPIWD